MPIIDALYIELLDTGIEKRSEEMSGVLLYVEKIENHIMNINIHVVKEYGALGANCIIAKFNYSKRKWGMHTIKLDWVS